MFDRLILIEKMCFKKIVIYSLTLFFTTTTLAQDALVNTKGETNVTRYLTKKMWNNLFPNRYNISSSAPLPGIAKTEFFSYEAFIAAAEKFPLFINEGDSTAQKRELAAFLANISEETSGGWDEAPGGYYKWGLHYLEELGCEKGCKAYTDTSKKNYPPVAGKSYHGRGPSQISWNYNYGQFSEAYYGDKDSLLQHPEIVSKDAVVSFASAIWFWMTTQYPKPSCHDVMVSKWVPTQKDKDAGRVPGFGATVNVINGGIECGLGKRLEKTKYRFGYYLYFCKYFKVTPGNNVDCNNQKPFGR